MLNIQCPEIRILILPIDFFPKRVELFENIKRILIGIKFKWHRGVYLQPNVNNKTKN